MGAFGTWSLLFLAAAFAQCATAGKPILYGFDLSRPTAMVITVAKIINFDYEYRIVNIGAGEQLQEWFVKINPQHTVPTLDDDGKIIWESSAVAAYIVDKYAKDDLLYPKDLHLRSMCLQRMMFVNTFLLQPYLDIFNALFGGATEYSVQSINTATKAYKFMEEFLANDPYLVGDHFTIPDISAVIMVAQWELILPIGKDHPKLQAWYERAKKNIPFVDEMIGQYPKMFDDILTNLIKKNKGN